jgi:hypothetical protein
VVSTADPYGRILGSLDRVPEITEIINHFLFMSAVPMGSQVGSCTLESQFLFSALQLEFSYSHN